MKMRNILKSMGGEFKGLELHFLGEGFLLLFAEIEAGFTGRIAGGRGKVDFLHVDRVGPDHKKIFLV